MALPVALTSGLFGEQGDPPPQPPGRHFGSRLALACSQSTSPPQKSTGPSISRRGEEVPWFSRRDQGGVQGGEGTRMHPTVFSLQTGQPTFPLGFRPMRATSQAAGLGGSDQRAIFLQPRALSGARSRPPAEPAGQASEPVSPQDRFFAISRDRLQWLARRALWPFVRFVFLSLNSHHHSETLKHFSHQAAHSFPVF